MKKKKNIQERPVSEGHWFFFLIFMGLLTRLPFLKIFKAETTDGVLCLNYFTSDMSPYVFLPGYPSLLWLGEHLGLSGWLWGRFLSALASLLFLIPFWKFLRRWVSVDMAGIACLMALFSPLLWEWSLRVMTDTPFLLFFWWALELLTAAFAEKNEKKWMAASLMGAMAALIRPEGFLIFPWVFLTARSRLWKEKPFQAWGAVSLWIPAFYFLKERLSTILLAYREGLGLTEGTSHVSFPFLNFLEHFYAYLTQPVFVFTPLVFWFAVLGLAKMARRPGPEGDAFKKIILQIYILVFLSRLIPTAYQDRHMLLFLPLLLAAAAYHIETFFKSLGPATSWTRILLKNGLLTLCLVWLALFSASMFMAQNDSFGDIKRSAEFLRTLPEDSVIYSDEVPKTQYWSGRKVMLMPYLAENTPFDPRPGDIIVLHSFYIPRIWFVDRHLSDKHDVKLLDDEQSMVVPLLTDVMEKPELQNRVTATAFRFAPQFFRSRVYRVQK